MEIKNCKWCNSEFIIQCPIVNKKFCTKKCAQASYRNDNRDRLRIASREWTANNPDRSREIKRKYNHDHPEAQQRWYEKNKQEVIIALNISTRPEMRARQQAKRIANKLGMIKECSINDDCNGRIELHHIDHNPFNNDPANFIYLCRKHHMQDHRK